MILKFIHINGESYSLDMNDDATIQQTKIALIYLYQLQYHALEFVINGCILNDDEVISQIGYHEDSYIIFYEPEPPEEIDDISPFFGSIPQVCNSSGAPSFSEKDVLPNVSSDGYQNIDPFQEIEKGNDQKYMKYVIEPSFIQDPQDPYSDYNKVSFNGNEVKLNASQRQTKFQNLYKNNIDELTKSIYPQDEILQKTKKSIDRLGIQAQYINTEIAFPTQNNSNSFAKTKSNDHKNMNARSFTNSSSNLIVSSSNTPQMNSNFPERIDFNHPYLNNTFHPNPFS